MSITLGTTFEKKYSNNIGINYTSLKPHDNIYLKSLNCALVKSQQIFLMIQGEWRKF